MKRPLQSIAHHGSVHAAFRQSAGEWSERPFVHIPASAARAYSATAIDLTYGAADADVAGLSASHAALAIGQGQRIALLLGNRADFLLHFLALNGLGASIVPLNGESSPAEIAHILRDSGCAATIALPGHRKVLRDALAQLDAPPPTIWHGDTDAEAPLANDIRTAHIDEAALLYTSGSTGAPKGCMLSNEYMLGMGRWYNAIDGLCAVEPGAERLITPLPLTHMNALAVSSMAMIAAGGCIIQLERFQSPTWWQTVRESQATIVHYLGVMPAMLLRLPASDLDRKHNLKFGFGAGAHPKHHAAFEQRFGLPLIESWSMTEVGAGAVVVAQREPRHVGSRCFGKPEAFMQYRLVDADGADVATGTPGELWVRAVGPDPRKGFFSGYANQPELTAAAWEHDYFHTGDVVRAGADGALHFVDRKKSIVRRSGENIASLEVEAVLNQLAQVQGVGVGPVEDELRGEEVMACIELAAGHAATVATARAIFAAAASSMAYFKLPGYIAFVAELPLTSTQKLQRGQLREISRALVENGLAFDLRAYKKRNAATGAP